MDITTWQPHGFICHPGFETLYTAARATVLNNIVIESNERSANDLFSYLLVKYIFAANGYNLSLQKPPLLNGQKQRDFPIQYFTKQYDWQDLCFVEESPANNEAGFQISCIEQQAITHCVQYLEAHPDVPQIYAMTLVGVKLRCWVCESHAGAMRGLWGGDMSGTYDDYLGIGSDTNAPVIEKAFRDMKSWAAEVGGIDTYPL